MVIDELLQWGLNILKKKDFNNPLLEVRLIMAKLLNVDKSYIYSYGEKAVSEEIADEFKRLIIQRSTDYPIQYILGENEFMGLNFYLEEGVLIPRPDTEVLVEYIIDYIDKNFKNENINILDLGIGSGAISLSIAKYCPKAYVYGVDIGYIPIKVANINKDRFNLKNVEFVHGDLFGPIESLNMKKSFQIIVSNPPYIPRKDIENLQGEIKNFEPRLALDGGIDGLDFYRKITNEAKEYLKDNGLLIYEIGYDQGNDVSNILSLENFRDINILKDLNDLDRVVMGVL